MKERSGMPYDVVAYETDDLAMLLNETEEGIFHRMLRRAWMNGSVPADLTALARICRTHPARLKKSWNRLQKLWVPHPSLAGRLINPKQERERAYVAAKRDANRQSAVEGWKLRKNKENVDANAMPSQCVGIAPLPHPFPLPQKNANIEKELSDSSLAEGMKNEPSARPRDSAMDYFCGQCRTLMGVPYLIQKKDAVQLAVLRKKFGTGNLLEPPRWTAGVDNYFASPLSSYSLADLCVRYEVFSNSALDGYNKPINHQNRYGVNGNGTKSKAKRITEERDEDVRNWLRDRDENIS